MRNFKMTKEEIELYVEELISEEITWWNNNGFGTQIFNELDIVKILLNNEYNNFLIDYFDPGEGQECGVKDANGKWLFHKDTTEHFKNDNVCELFLFFSEEEETIYLNTLFRKIGWDFKYKKNIMNEGGITAPGYKRWESVFGSDTQVILIWGKQ